MLKAITIATYDAAAGSRSRSSYSSTSRVPRFLSLHAAIIHFYVSPVFFHVNEKFLVFASLFFFISFYLFFEWYYISTNLSIFNIDIALLSLIYTFKYHPFCFRVLLYIYCNTFYF